MNQQMIYGMCWSFLNAISQRCKCNGSIILEDREKKRDSGNMRNYGFCHGCSFVDGVFIPSGRCPNHEPWKLQREGILPPIRNLLAISSSLIHLTYPTLFVRSGSSYSFHRNTWLALFFLYLYLTPSVRCDTKPVDAKIM